ncbi:hypothetical protein VCRA2119O147_490028 [Vibrio crassostreae]|uniref:Uncharacterized protein n=1 Tax=Vibrio crassostreae TaxID=246167 RepID=A0A4R3PDB6_9VIBR|nr:hypothetical protein [Vibrio crassostreae]MDH5950798.1 hypothetical protein [Vibrio crassostreae]ROO49858.1 hypothetical protein EDB56_10929 [Vibrio crassostreae]ROO53585.1 hypothetical protein EDB58_110134 [Vibrio crassostreae]ROO66236.1 hypothetical protein EDB64_4309 [Vibrio crassostreae]ROO66595.1 hypothetical protein EDB57_4147 [Vibrio crassostreae]
MAKRFCKLNRRDITEHLGEIHSLVTEPKFVCRSCARSSADQANLCKPTAIPPIGCQNKPVEEKVACGLLAETLPAPELSLAEINETIEPSVQMFDPAATDIVPELAKKEAAPKKAKLKKLMAKASSDEKAELKQAKKAAKKQEKYNKKLAKMIKKQQKLFKKSQKLESDLERINLQLDDVAFTETKTQVVSHNHIH